MRFAASLPDAEVVDFVPMTEVQKREKKADLFLDGRKIVAEVKSLESDVSPKVERILEPFRQSPHYPVYFGSWPIEEVLARLPNGKDIKRQIYESVTAGVEKIVGDANRQIRATKRSFYLPSARGLLIILNEDIEILDPRFIAHRVGKTLMKRTAAGAPRFDEIEAVWIFGETHRVAVTENAAAVPCLLMPHPLLSDEAVLNVALRLQKPWAEYCGVPLIEMPTATLESLDLQAAPSKDKLRTIADRWRDDYAVTPYLESLTDTELIEYGARVTLELALVQQSPRVTRNAMLRGTRRWADLNEELNRRHVDIRLVRQLADEEGMKFVETPEILERAKVLVEVCDTALDSAEPSRMPARMGEGVRRAE